MFEWKILLIFAPGGHGASLALNLRQSLLTQAKLINYNLSGQRVADDHRGIVIRNGQKQVRQ